MRCPAPCVSPTLSFVLTRLEHRNEWGCAQDKSGSIEFVEFCMIIHSIKDRGRYATGEE
jgi:hypothetical protein